MSFEDSSEMRVVHWLSIVLLSEFTQILPSGTSGPKRRQIEVCGAEVVQVDGPRENAHIAALEAVSRQGLPYASHAAQPFGLAGIATIAFEIWETLGEMPGTVFCPIGHGSLFAGVLMGFDALVRAGMVASRPRLVGVQPEACAVVSTWHEQPFEGSLEQFSRRHDG